MEFTVTVVDYRKQKKVIRTVTRPDQPSALKAYFYLNRRYQPPDYQVELAATVQAGQGQPPQKPAARRDTERPASTEEAQT